MIFLFITYIAIGTMTAFNDPNSCKYWPRDLVEAVNVVKPLACKIAAPEGRKCDCPIWVVEDPPYGECPESWTDHTGAIVKCEE